MSRYQFNRDQLRFVEVGRGIRSLLRRGGMWILVSMLLAVVYYFLFSSLFNTPEEQELIRERRTLSQEYRQLSEKMTVLDQVLNELEERDKEVYRTLFKSDPPDIGHESSTALYQALSSAGYYDLVLQTDTIYKRLDRKSEQINGLFRSIASSLSPEKIESIPDIIPLQDVDIHRVGATVGERIHPFYKTIRMHTGLDIIAALGNSVLAPADGIVTAVTRSSRGSGNTVTIEHTSGYRTVYAHLSENIMVRRGQKVTKGMVIARVGNSGMVLATHLHYEIWKDDEMMNPMHFFYAQLNPEEYTQLMIAGYNSGQSLD